MEHVHNEFCEARVRTAPRVEAEGGQRRARVGRPFVQRAEVVVRRGRRIAVALAPLGRGARGAGRRRRAAAAAVAAATALVFSAALPVSRRLSVERKHAAHEDRAAHGGGQQVQRRLLGRVLRRGVAQPVWPEARD